MTSSLNRESQRPGAGAETGAEVREVNRDHHKGLTGQNEDCSPKVFSEGDNMIQFLFY